MFLVNSLWISYIGNLELTSDKCASNCFGICCCLSQDLTCSEITLDHFMRRPLISTSSLRKELFPIANVIRCSDNQQFCRSDTSDYDFHPTISDLLTGPLPKSSCLFLLSVPKRLKHLLCSKYVIDNVSLFWWLTLLFPRREMDRAEFFWSLLIHWLVYMCIQVSFMWNLFPWYLVVSCQSRFLFPTFSLVIGRPLQISALTFAFFELHIIPVLFPYVRVSAFESPTGMWTVWMLYCTVDKTSSWGPFLWCRSNSHLKHSVFEKACDCHHHVFRDTALRQLLYDSLKPDFVEGLRDSQYQCATDILPIEFRNDLFRRLSAYSSL